MLLGLPQGCDFAMGADPFFSSLTGALSAAAVPAAAAGKLDTGALMEMEDVMHDSMGLPHTPPGVETPPENAIPDIPLGASDDLVLSTPSSEVTHSLLGEDTGGSSHMSPPRETGPSSEYNSAGVQLRSPAATLLNRPQEQGDLQWATSTLNAAGYPIHTRLPCNLIHSFDSPLAATAPPAIGTQWETADGLIQRREAPQPRRLSLDIPEERQHDHHGVRTRRSSHPQPFEPSKATRKQSEQKKRCSPSSRRAKTTTPRKKVVTPKGKAVGGAAKKSSTAKGLGIEQVTPKPARRSAGRRRSTGSTWGAARCATDEKRHPMQELDFDRRGPQFREMESGLLFATPSAKKDEREQEERVEESKPGKTKKGSSSSSRRRRSGIETVPLLPPEPSFPLSKPPPGRIKHSPAKGNTTSEKEPPPAKPGEQQTRTMSGDWVSIPDELLKVSFNLHDVKGQKGQKELKVDPVLDYSPDMIPPETPVWLRQHILLKMLTEGARTYRALVPDHKYKMLAVFAAIHCRVLSVGPDGSRSDIGQLAPAPAWERENEIKNTFRDWARNNLEGTLVFVSNIEAARHTLSKACKMTRNEKEAWIVESLLAGDCIIQVFNQKKRCAEEKLDKAANEQKVVAVRNQKSLYQDLWLQMVPLSQIDEVIQRCHRSIKPGCEGDHLGVVETFDNVQEHYYGVTRCMVEAALKYCTAPKCMKHQHTNTEFVEELGARSSAGKPKVRKTVMTEEEIDQWKEMFVDYTAEAEECLLRVAEYTRRELASRANQSGAEMALDTESDAICTDDSLVLSECESDQ